MKILVTGSGGFIGKNLCVQLEALGDCQLFKYDIQTSPELLERYAADCDFVFHLAGVNRPEQPSEFEDNFKFTSALLKALRNSGKNIPVLMSSSIQAQLDNPYGLSKRKAEDLVKAYAQETGADIYIFRLPGVFGKWCAPNYNSVVATFCHNIARGLPVRMDDPDTEISLVYIDDVLQSFTAALQGDIIKQNGFCQVTPVHHTTVSELERTIRGFRDSRQNLELADMAEPLTRKLYSTYLSYLPDDQFCYALKEHRDQRGAFAECLKSVAGGQISVNITRPGMTKGGHWHHTKTEKFIAVNGCGILRFQKLGGGDILKYSISSEKLEVVDIPPGYIHDVTNTGSSDLVLLIWASQLYDPEHPDTYPAVINDNSCKKE